MFVIARCIGNNRDVLGDMGSTFRFKCSENMVSQTVVFAGRFEIDREYIIRLEEMPEEEQNKKTLPF